MDQRALLLLYERAWPPRSAILCEYGQRRGAGVAIGDFGWFANFIWGIADDVLRDLYNRGKVPRGDFTDDGLAAVRYIARGNPSHFQTRLELLIGCVF